MDLCEGLELGRFGWVVMPGFGVFDVQVFYVLAVQHLLQVAQLFESSAFLPSLVTLGVEDPVEFGDLVGLLFQPPALPEQLLVVVVLVGAAGRVVVRFIFGPVGVKTDCRQGKGVSAGLEVVLFWGLHEGWSLGQWLWLVLRGLSLWRLLSVYAELFPFLGLRQLDLGLLGGILLALILLPDLLFVPLLQLPLLLPQLILLLELLALFIGLELLLLPFLQVHLLPEIVIILLALLLPLVLLPLNISNEAERLPLRPELLVLPVGADAGPLALYLILELFPVGLLDLLARVLPIQEHV